MRGWGGGYWRKGRMYGTDSGVLAAKNEVGTKDGTGGRRGARKTEG